MIFKYFYGNSKNSEKVGFLDLFYFGFSGGDFYIFYVINWVFINLWMLVYWIWWNVILCGCILELVKVFYWWYCW